MAEVISIIKYLCTAAAGAVGALASLYLYTSYNDSQTQRLNRPLRVLITAAGGMCRVLELIMTFQHLCKPERAAHATCGAALQVGHD